MMRTAAVVLSFGLIGTRAGKAPLPDVDAVLQHASSKAQDFAAQALAMQQEVDKRQETSRTALSAKKVEYQLKLDQIANQSEAIRVENSELQVSNRNLERKSAAMLESANRVQSSNAQLRSTIQTVMEKVSAAQLFLDDSLKVTDDSNAEDLEVLVPTTPPPTLDHFLAVTKSNKVSLLSIRTQRPNDDPKALVPMLSDSLAEIASAEAEGAAVLKAHFLASYADQRDRQAALNATHASLLKDQAGLEEHLRKLEAAVVHLKATSKQLKERLGGLHVFAGALDSSVASSLSQEEEEKKETVKATETANTTAAATATKEPRMLLREAKKLITAAVNSTLGSHATPKVPARKAAASAALRANSTAAKFPFLVPGAAHTKAPSVAVGWDDVATWKSWLLKLR